jgi:hypothetical protein
MAKGTWNQGSTLTTTGQGVRMFWYPKKAAFRAGRTFNTEWNDSVIGNYSSAFGYGAKAKGDNSSAFGYSSVALGYASFTVGQQDSATGSSSFSAGAQNNATGSAAIALGKLNRSDGDQTFVAGARSKANNDRAWAIGESTTSSGKYSGAVGYNIYSESQSEVVVGQYNQRAATPSPNSAIGTSKIFSVGNGANSGARSNAMTVLFGGQVGLQSVTTPTMALHLPNNTDTSKGSARAYSWLTYSDQRIKSDISPTQYGLSTILQLNPVDYFHHSSIYENGNAFLPNGKPNLSAIGKKDVGFLAQELYQFIPEAVHKPKDETQDLWSVDYMKLVPVLTKAIQEQQTEIEVLQQQNEAILRELEELKKLLQDKQ